LATIWPLPTRGQQRSQRNQVCLRINGGKTAGGERQASSASSRRNRIGVLEENFECEPRQISANDSVLLMPIFASLVAGERCEGYVSIWSPCPQRLSWRTMAAPSNGQGQDENLLPRTAPEGEVTARHC
jgi:hypothetical protein